MPHTTLRKRALVFALCAGGVAFFLAFLVTAQALTAGTLGQALILAIICGAFSWASAERTVSSTAAAMDLAIARLALAGDGDLDSPMPPEIERIIPSLARSMDALFRRLRASIDEIEQLAMYDPVTGLANRLQVRQQAERRLGAMPHDQPAALLFIDLDRFKAVNDTRGHAAGDQLLEQVAGRLRAVAGGVDAEHGGAQHRTDGGADVLVGRLAGDEFTLFLPDATERAAQALGAAVLDALSEPFEIGGACVRIGASIGVALRPAHGATLHELMRAADAAMYEAKAAGRGRVETYTEALAGRLADQDHLDADLHRAVAAREFTLVFQPQLSLRDGRTVAAEALVRWRHPVDGALLPAAFLHRAEATGLIGPIGEAVIADVAATIARWGREGRHERVSINLSRRQIDQPDFFPRLTATLVEAGAPARLLEIEINETLAMQASPDALVALGGLRGEGATIAVDGFGMGFSNPHRLRLLPIDRIKLDRRIIAGIVDDARARSIAQATITLVHALGCEAVGEGVETAAQAEMLRVIGCDTVQGFGIAQPMDDVAFRAWTAAQAGVAAAGASDGWAATRAISPA
ncbi:putative bifunctional diguanylate cyclase/phosphodiesterase [uncultured Sphingomonas sp.]|uniref:putative bifunctional diguanylate cyclase/phosphodiesterase n=1 Tax=uncultured Sphingomonas sp. TaxID=158754 RepID=UPI0035C98410